jgi:parallel beta-helix repeat protein
VLFDPGAAENYLFDCSVLNFNDVGVEFNGCQSNVVQGNTIWYNAMYGFYFVNGSQNEYAGNSLLGNGAPEFPTPPWLIVTWPAEGSTVNGTVTISWSQGGESPVPTTVTIDGVPNIATGNSFLWNTTGSPDGEHAIVVNVTDTGGFSASQAIYLFTDNQLLAIEATISRLNETLTSITASEASLNATVQNLRSELSSLNQTLLSQISSLNEALTSSMTSEASLNATVQNLRSELGSLNQTLLRVDSEASSLEAQLGSLNASLKNTQANVNAMKTGGYIAIAAVILAAIVAAAVILMQRRQRKV